MERHIKIIQISHSSFIVNTEKFLDTNLSKGDTKFLYKYMYNADID